MKCFCGLLLLGCGQESNISICEHKKLDALFELIIFMKPQIGSASWKN